MKAPRDGFGRSVFVQTRFKMPESLDLNSNFTLQHVEETESSNDLQQYFEKTTVLPTPNFREIPEDPFNEEISKAFWERFSAGLIIHEPSKGIKNADRSTSEFSKSERLLCFELFHTFGADWNLISKHLCYVKTSKQLEQFYEQLGPMFGLENDKELPQSNGDAQSCEKLICEVCRQAVPSAEFLVSCHCCDRGYHLDCLDTPPSNHPDKMWFCSEECKRVSEQCCKICQSHQDEANMLLCDSCDQGYHLNCLEPPLKAVPFHDWYCPSCKTEKHSEQNTTSKVIEDFYDLLINSVRWIPKSEFKLWLKKFPNVLAWDQVNSACTLLQSFLFQCDLLSLPLNFPLDHELISRLMDDLLKAVSSSMQLLLSSTLASFVQQSQNGKPNLNPFREEKRQKHIGTIKPKRKRKLRTSIPVHNFESDDPDRPPNWWIFQANPNYYNIRESIKHLPKMTWFIRQHIREIRKGDKVFIWESGPDAGILATATLLSEPQNILEAAEMKRFCVVKDVFKQSQLRSWIEINEVLPSKLQKKEILADPLLGKLTILRAPIGTNFKVSQEQADLLLERIKQSLDPSFIPAKPSSTASYLRNLAASSPSIQPRKRTMKQTKSKNKTNEVTRIFSRALMQSTVRLSTSPITKDDKECEMCSSPSEGDKMLLCDSCNKGYHMFCLNPPITQIPEGDWFCSDCQLSVGEVAACNELMAAKELGLFYRILLLKNCITLCSTNRRRKKIRNRGKDLDELATELRLFRESISSLANEKYVSWCSQVRTDDIEQSKQT